MKRTPQKSPSCPPAPPQPLTPCALDRVRGGTDGRRFETDFGDPIGNYNVR